MTPELEILLWAAGVDRDVHAISAPDPNSLLALLHTHNLHSRFFHCCQVKRPRWYTRALSIPVWNQVRAIEGRELRQIAEIQRISEALSPGAAPLIVIKGPATFATTGDRRHLRWSSDLDLLCRDNDCLFQTLLALGYTGTKNDGFGATKSNIHEFAVLTRGEMVIEIHNHFPVVFYPDEIRGADLVPAHHPPEWVQPLPVFRQSRVTYDQLAAQSMNGIAPEARQLRIPDPAASALILCAHEFRNYLHSPFTGMTVRLSALADIYDLARDSRFDTDRFLALAAQSGAGDSVNFVASLLLAYFGDQPLPVTALSFGEADFPQALSYSGGWASLSESGDILLQSGSETFIPRLGANRIQATAGRCLLTRRILNSPNAPIIEVSARHDQDALRLQIAFQEPLPEGSEYEIYAHSRHRASGPDAWGWEFIAADGRHGLTGPLQNLAFAWPSLPKPFRQGRRVPMTLAISRFRRDERLASGWFSGDGGSPLVVFPLEIMWEP